MKGYLILEHLENLDQPINMDYRLYRKKPNIAEDDEDRFCIKVKNVPMTNGKIWIGLWYDYGYGETINYANTREEIVEKSIEQLKIDYPLNDEVEPPFDMNSYVNYTRQALECRNCVTLQCHPLEPEEDLSGPVLLIKELTIV
jgi:hypothetical protein